MRNEKKLEDRMHEARQKKLAPRGIEAGESWGEGKDTETGQDVRDDAAPAASPKGASQAGNDRGDASA